MALPSEAPISSNSNDLAGSLGDIGPIEAQGVSNEPPKPRNPLATIADSAAAVGLMLCLLGFGAILLIDCAVRSWRGEVEYPYGGADETL